MQGHGFEVPNTRGDQKVTFVAVVFNSMTPDLPEQGPPPKASWRSKQKIQGSSRMFVTGQREKRVGAALVPGLEGDKAGDPPSPGNRFPAANSGGLFQCFLLLVAVVGGVAAVEGVRFMQN